MDGRGEDGASVAIAFGRVGDAAMALAAEGADLRRRGAALGRQVALLAPATPAFRLSSSGWLDIAPARALRLVDGAALREEARRALLGAMPPFAGFARRLVAAYLDELGTRTGPPAGAGERIGAVGHASDRFFAGLLPLAPAQLVVGAPASTGLTVPFDLVFWDGARVVGVLGGGEAALTPGRRRALDRLKERLGDRIEIAEVVAPPAAPGEPVRFPHSVWRALDRAPRPYGGLYRTAGIPDDLPG